jgi:anti-anti-sigma factor
VAALPNFRIETLKSGSRITIKLGGELDSAACGELVSQFERVAGNSSEIVLDLSEVSFIDSSGMRAIILVERSAGERGVALTTLPPPEAITDLLQMSGVADRVGLAPQAGQAAPTAPFLERIELDLTREPGAPARARAELREAFSARLSEADRATVTLLTSELVTNAVIHPGPSVGGSIGLRITAFRDRVRVEVTDAGAGFDAGSLPSRPREAGGHGLVVVDGLSSRWGMRHASAEGFCVWFEFDLEYDVSAAAAAAPEPAERSVATAEG